MRFHSYETRLLDRGFLCNLPTSIGVKLVSNHSLRQSLTFLKPTFPTVYLKCIVCVCLFFNKVEEVNLEFFKVTYQGFAKFYLPI